MLLDEPDKLGTVFGSRRGIPLMMGYCSEQTGQARQVWDSTAGNSLLPHAGQTKSFQNDAGIRSPPCISSVGPNVFPLWLDPVVRKPTSRHSTINALSTEAARQRRRGVLK